MANEIVVEQPKVAEQQQQQQSFELPADLKSQMDLALGLKTAEQPSHEQAQSNGQQQQPNASQEQQAAEPFKFDAFTEKFGWSKPEEAFAEIEQLRALKENPPVAAVPIWKEENEPSKKLFEALKAGKLDDVYSFLDSQRKLDKLTSAEVTKDNATDIVKYGMKLKNSELTDYEVDRLFNRKFQLPAKPVFNEVNDDETEYRRRLGEWERQVEEVNLDISIEAKMLKPDLLAAKSKLVLPDIDTAVDPNYQAYLQYLKDFEDEDKIIAETKEAYSSLKPEQIKFELPYKDEKNKVDFNFQFDPNTDGYKQALEMTLNPEKYYDSFKNSDGSPNRIKFLKSMYFSLNAEKVITEAIIQSKNATIKALLPDNNSQQNRQVEQIFEPTELDKQMAAAGIKKGSY